MMILYCILFLLFASIINITFGNHYDVLNIRPNAGEDEIKKSYRELAKKYHPDKNKDDPDAQEKFIAVGAAYEVLSNPQKRREYDLSFQQPFGNRNRHQHTHRYTQHFNRGARSGGAHTFHFQSGDGTFQFEQSIEIPPIVSMIIGFSIFALPLTMMCAPLCCIWVILRLCGFRKSSPEDSDNKTTDAREKLTEHWQRDYLPHLTRRGLKAERRIIVASLSSKPEVLSDLRQCKEKYTRDPVYFSRCSEAVSSVHDVIAFCKQGKKFCLRPHECNDTGAWIDKLLNGEVKWESIDLLPSDIKLNVY